MPQILNPLNITVNTGGTVTLPTGTSHDYFIFSGTSTLASGYSVTPAAGAVEGMQFNIKWGAAVTYSGGNVVTIFGTVLTQVQALSELSITAYYNGSSWEVDIHVDAESLPNNYNGVETTTVPSGGGTVTLVSGINKVTQRFTGTVTLSSSYTIRASTITASEGDVFEIIWNSVCTLGVNSVTIFGISLDSIQALSGNVTISAVFNGSAWIAQLIEGELKVNSVTNPMLAQMPTMTIKGNDTGGTGNAKDLTVSEILTMLSLGNLGLTDVTFSQLTSLISGNTLVPGRFYRITDYRTIYDQPDYDVSGNLKGSLTTKTSAVAEPLVVLATSVNTIGTQVWSALHPLDIIHYDVTFTQTEIMNVPAKGRIVYRKDEYNNETYYDHRYVVFKRYETSTGSTVFTIVNDNGEASQEISTFGTGCYNNKIGYCNPSLTGGVYLNNNIFGDSCTSNVIGTDSWNNTIGTTAMNNNFGELFAENLIGNLASNNIIKDRFQLNVIGNNMLQNNISSQFQGNTIVNNFQMNNVTANVVSQNFTSATHVYGIYECNIFKGFSLNRLSYFDGSDVLTVVNITA